ncbi:MAG: DUF421 domain-containing protein [Nocardiaceae bacterium]|nr:DUF421 domain-containing protein [Nocardiaceae bacterium]
MLANQFRLDLDTVIATVLVTTAMYAVYLLLSRVTGSRGLSNYAPFDFAAFVAVGAIIGRTALLQVPTLGVGATALVTLFVLRALLGVIAMTSAGDRFLNGSPILLGMGGELDRQALRRAHVHEHDVRQALRRAGVQRLEDMEYLILERNGMISVLRGEVEPWLLADVRSRE